MKSQMTMMVIVKFVIFKKVNQDSSVAPRDSLNQTTKEKINNSSM
jgi:hypothetical protein